MRYGWAARRPLLKAAVRSRNEALLHRCRLDRAYRHECDEAPTAQIAGNRAKHPENIRRFAIRRPTLMLAHELLCRTA